MNVEYGILVMVGEARRRKLREEEFERQPFWTQVWIVVSDFTRRFNEWWRKNSDDDWG